MGPQNAVKQAIITGGAKYNTRGDNLSHGSADTFILDFEADNQPKYLHMVKNARMRQEPQPGKAGSPGQPMEIAADQLDFVIEERQRTADRRYRRQGANHDFPCARRIASRQGRSEESVKTWARQPLLPWRRQASFTQRLLPAIACRLCMARPMRVSSHFLPASPTRSAPRKTSTLSFAPDGGVEKLVQTGDFQYHEPSANPDTGGRAMFADKATYTPADETLVLRVRPARLTAA